MTKYLVLMWVAAAMVVAADLRIVGSDLLGLEASRALYGFSGRAGIPLTLALDGSRPGLAQLGARKSDLALLVLAPGEDEALKGFESFSLGYHCVVVVVPTVVPLEQITLGQLRDVFGESGSRNLGRWGDLGLEGEIAGSAIVPLVPAVGQGIAVEFFRHAVLKDRPFKSNVARYSTPAELTLRLSGDRRAIALAPGLPPNAPEVKLVRVALREGQPPYSPTAENVHSGDYPLALPLRIVFHRDAAASLRPLLRFLFGDDFASVLSQADVVPLASAARRQQLLAVEKL